MDVLRILSNETLVGLFVLLVEEHEGGFPPAALAASLVEAEILKRKPVTQSTDTFCRRVLSGGTSALADNPAPLKEVQDRSSAEREERNSEHPFSESGEE